MPIVYERTPDKSRLDDINFSVFKSATSIGVGQGLMSNTIETGVTAFTQQTIVEKIEDRVLSNQKLQSLDSPAIMKMPQTARKDSRISTLSTIQADLRENGFDFKKVRRLENEAASIIQIWFRKVMLEQKSNLKT